MKVTVADLDHKRKDILKALHRRESVRVFCHGKLKFTLEPVASNLAFNLAKHPFFGSSKKTGRKVPEIMNSLRGYRT